MRKQPRQTCGDEGGKSKAGKPCGRAAGAGTLHNGRGRCSKHGGSLPGVQVAEVVAQAREGGLMGGPLPIAPGPAILECIARTNAQVNYWTGVVEQLEAKEAAGPTITQTRRPQQVGRGEEDPNKMVVETTLGPADIHIAIKAKTAAEERLVKFSEAALRAGVEERMIKLAEFQALPFVELLRFVEEKRLGRKLSDDDNRQLNNILTEFATTSESHGSR